MYPTYAQKYGKARAQRYIVYAAQGLLDTTEVTRAMDKALLLGSRPDIKRRFWAETDGDKRRAGLGDYARWYRTTPHLRLGIDALDAVIAGGAGIVPGEVLHLVAGEGGHKTALALQAVEHYARSGGRALYLSLDMHPREIELRLLMRIMGCGRDRALIHAEANDATYIKACDIRHEIDDNLRVIGGPLNLEGIRAAILTSDAQIIALDYVTLVSGYKSELDAARDVTAAIRQMRNAWGTTFILISQMSRESGRYARSGDTGGHGKGGSALEQLVDYEIELLTDAPLYDGGRPRTIAFLRKNRNGKNNLYFELFPGYPQIDFAPHAEFIGKDAQKRKVIFPNKF
jgi:KaiC/GvpD/RAD55 family RecA-like ATPase